jgi:hypothetical protein
VSLEELLLVVKRRARASQPPKPVILWVSAAHLRRFGRVGRGSNFSLIKRENIIYYSTYLYAATAKKEQ